jgi:hypothetical protein
MRARVRIFAATMALVLLGGAIAEAGGVIVKRRHRHHDRHDHRVRPELYLDMPLDDYSTDVIFPFGGSHHAVPGVVSVNRAPYRCLPHERVFRARAHFVAHLRLDHGLTDATIPSAIVVDQGQAIYIGE